MGKICTWIYYHFPMPIRFRLRLTTRYDKKLVWYINRLLKQFHDTKVILQALIDKSDSLVYTEGLVNAYKSKQEIFEDVNLHKCFPRTYYRGDEKLDPEFEKQCIDSFKPQILKIISERKFNCMMKSKWSQLFIRYKYHADGLVIGIEECITALENQNIEWIGKLIPVWENKNTYHCADYIAKSLQNLIQLREDLIEMLKQERKDLIFQRTIELEFLNQKQKQDIKKLLTT